MKKGSLAGRILAVLTGISLCTLSVSYSVSAEEYGVDVSRYQGDISWEELAGSGMSFAILRTGTTTYGEDSRFEEYYQGTRDTGMKAGAYLYVSALSLEEFKDAAEQFIQYLDGKEWEMPVYIDLEDNEQTLLGKQTLTTCALACMNIIRNAGYTTGIYSNKYWFTNFLDRELISKAGFEIWYAQYPDVLVNPLDYDKSDVCGIWQYSSHGKVEGIPDSWVDLNIAYKIYNEKQQEKKDEELWLIPYLSRKTMRTGPGDEYGEIIPVPQNTYISVTEKTDVNGTLWGQFMYDGYVGWCTLDGMVDCSVSGEMNPYLFYDVNLDGIVNIGDDLALKKYLLGDGESSFGDLNGDGVVNIFDRQRLRAYILGAGG